MSENLVDARGLSCPEPVLLAKDALREYGANSFTVAVSSPTARDNVAALLEKKGRSAHVEEKDGAWYLTVD